MISIRLAAFSRTVSPPPKSPGWLIALLALLCSLAMPNIAQARDVLVGIYDNKPKIFLDTNEQAAGIFVDILRNIAEKESWKLKYVPCNWRDCLTQLQAGQIDLMPDMAYSEEREKIFAFHATPALFSWSQAYRHPDVSVVSIIDLKDKKIAVLAGSVQEIGIKEILGNFGIKADIMPTRSLDEAFVMVERHKADIALANHHFGDFHAQNYKLKDTPIVFQPAKLFFASGKDRNKDLLETIDKHLRAWQGESNSLYFEIIRQWGPAKSTERIPGELWWLLAGLGAIGLIASLSTFLARQHASRQTEALRESEARLRGIFDSVSEAILIHELHTGRILQVNKRMCKMFGCTEAEALSHSIDQFASGNAPYSADDAERWLKKVITDGPQLFNWQVKRLDNGNLFPVEVSLRSTRLGRENCILAVVRKTSIHDQLA